MKGPILVALLTAALASGQAPDNTKTNQRDRGGAPVTADQQAKNKSDTELVKQIRKAVYEDKSLSTYAHNVKIIAQSGHVTLRGPVRTQTERDAVQQKAATVAGAEHVVNELEVVPAK